MAQSNKGKTKTAKKTKPKTSGAKKTAAEKAKLESRNQNLIALLLLVLGMVFLLSITTNALGAMGTTIKAILLGQFAKMAVLMALAMIVIGIARLVYSSKFGFDNISPIMLILIFLGITIFYGAINSKVLMDKFDFVSLKKVFLQSVVGKNIGIWPYMLTYMLVGLIGKWGMILCSVTIFLFVAIYYFRLSFTKIGDASIVIANEGKKVAQGIGKKTMDYVMNDEDTAPQKKKLEKLDETRIEDKFSFMERYKSEVAEFTEFMDIQSQPPMEENQQEEMTPEKVEKDKFSEKEERELREFEEKYGQPSDFTEPLNNEPLINNYEIEEVMREDDSLNASARENMIEEQDADDLGITKKFDGLSSIIEQIENQESAQAEENGAAQKPLPIAIELSDGDVVDKRKIHQDDKLKKENIQELAIHEKTDIRINQREYTLPSTALLKNYKIENKNKNQQIKDVQKLESTLAIFGIEGKVVNVSVGPTITRFELQLKIGVKVSKILNLSDDLALALAAVAPVRIEAPIPGTSLIGIEVPNAQTDIVSYRSVLESDKFAKSTGKLPVALGRDVSGKAIVEDIAKMPHLLVAGATGSGKSVCINTLICSILYKSKPEDVKMIMIDPKMVELSVYNNIPHLLVPVVTDMKKAPYALSWAVNEMNNRYKLLAENRVRDLDGYNAIKGVEKLPRIVIIVDELADLMMVSPNEVEDAIIRLAQKARACGMHLVIATQRPSVDVITGLIKANIPTRIAFAVSSQVDSRTILDQAGAEKLIGKGDMLFSHPSTPKPQRIQGSFVSDDEVNAVVDFILKQGHAPSATTDIIEETIRTVEVSQREEEKDTLLDEIIEFAIENKQISTSLIQRRFRIGYNRASRIIDRLEEMGIVSESDGAKPRKVLISSNDNRQIEIDEG